MSLNFSKPSALLEPYIKQYWMVQNHLTGGHRYSHKIVPSGLMELSFYLGSKPVVVKSKESRRSDRTLLTGQLLNFYEVEISETLDLFSITFQPQGAMRFFELPLYELSNQTIAWKEVFSGSIRQVEEQLYEANSFHERVRIADAFLYKKLLTNQECRNFARINNSVRKIDLTKGKVSIDKLASDACLSRKQFERNFTSGIGIPPKQFLKVVRFQHAIYQKQLSPDLNLTRLALDSGYYDQSHMINDFRALSGNSPSNFFSHCLPYSDYFSI